MSGFALAMRRRRFGTGSGPEKMNVSHVARGRFRSASSSSVVVRRARLSTVGDRAFLVAAASMSGTSHRVDWAAWLSGT